MTTIEAVRERRVDPVTQEVVRNALVAVAEQMAICIARCAHSSVIREILDYSTAVFDPQGGIIAQAARIPMHLNSMTDALQMLIRHRYPLGTWADGDVYITNDPYMGGQHLPDIQTFAPVFVGGEVVAICGALGHHLDVGGRAPGSYGADATEIYQEGFRIPPSRLARQGVMNELFFDLLAANIRVPEKTVADLRAQLAALEVGKAEVRRLAHKYGNAMLRDAMAALADTSEARMRAAIAAFPDGTYTAQDYVDDDGLGSEPLLIRAQITVQGSDLTVDFAGSAPQTPGPINCPIASTESLVYYVIISVLDPSVPANSGCYRPIRIVAPSGSIVNPRLPGAVVGRNVVAHRIATVMLEALGQAIPERVPAAYYGNSNVFIVSNRNDRGGLDVIFDIAVGGWGARPTKDGPDVYSAGLHNLANIPLEMAELEFPLRFVRYEMIQDSGGAGRFRGGLGAERSFRILRPSALGTQFDRVRFPPPGLAGGKPGAPGRIVVERANQALAVPSKALRFPLEPGDVVRLMAQGGGGHGDPCERDRALVARDLVEEKVSERAAREVYGYVAERQRITLGNS
ncbi:MAG: hydantoinase B/oxoprolinase family protein [Chloroflexi bacterium]|nr:hydantoinase B/oxoprolinase family protein [Chloroflexota bacterium]